MNEQEFVDRVKNISRETFEEVKGDGDVDSGLSEKIAEEVEKQLDKWESKTTQDRKKALEGLKEGLKTGGRAGATAGEDKSVFDADGQAGSTLAKAMPFIAHEYEKSGGQVNLSDVKKRAEEGLPNGKKSEEVAGQVDKFLSSGKVEDGPFVTNQQANDFIRFLYDTTVVRRAGAQSIEMPSGGLKIPVQDGSVSANWISPDGGSASESEPSFSEKRMEAKKLAVMVVLSEDLIRRSPRGVEQLVLTDMRRRSMLEEDYGFLLGDGQPGKPKGLYHQMADSNQFDRTVDGSSNVTIDTIIRDLMRCIYKVEAANIVPQTPGWIMHPRTVRHMMTLRGSDSFLFMSQLAQGNLLGAPVHMTNALPQTLDDSGDGSNDETRIMYGDFSQVLIGDTLNLRIATSQEATVKLGNDWRSMLQDDLRAIVLFHEVDMLLRHTESFAAINGVDYGANFDS